VDLDLGRRGTEMRYRGSCTAEGKMGGGGGGKCDLKAGHKRPETEYVRTYTCAFDRTRAGEWCVCACDVRTYLSKFERTRAVQWVCEGRGGRTHKGKVERSA
jgi:hypothetical protein